jgi:type II secretory pathway pseudopilin PulG
MIMRPVVMRAGPGLLGTVARTAVIAGTATVTSNAITTRQQRRQQEQAAAQQAAYEQQQAAYQQQQPPAYQQPPAPAAPAGGVELTAELQKLAALRQSGALTDEEFAAAKARLLA